MTTTINTTEYALMAGAAYDSTRDDQNKAPYPESFGWNPIKGELNHRVVDSSGFEARTFIRESDNAIVISYAGTYFPQSADLVADIAIGAGFAHNQLLQAARYYQDVKKWAIAQGYSADNISFTGHSLGGGLAALMGVFFNKKAVVFDEAPLQLSFVGRISYLRNPPNKKFSINDEVFNISTLLTQEVA